MVGELLLDLLKQQSNMRQMFQVYADEFPQSVCKRRGDKWFAALRAYVDLIECYLPEVEKRKDMDTAALDAAGRGEG